MPARAQEHQSAHSGRLVALRFAFTLGFITGSQDIAFAHEMGHSKSKLDRFCAWVLMSSVYCGHLTAEHYRGHHPRAATHDDAATSRRGESLYQFLPRTLWGSLQSGWRLEALRVPQVKSGWLHSPLAWSTLASFMVFALLASYLQEQLATKVVAYFALQLVVAFLLLETVNCIEHYGLQRNEADGKREPFGMMHAWNADHVAITPCWLIFSATQAITRKPGNATQHRSRCQARSYPPDTQAACCSLWCRRCGFH